MRRNKHCQGASREALCYFTARISERKVGSFRKYISALRFEEGAARGCARYSQRFIFAKS